MFAYLAYYAFLSSVSLAYAGADEFFACPAVSSSTRVYSADGEKLEILIGRSMDEWDMVADYDPSESDDIRS